MTAAVTFAQYAQGFGFAVGLGAMLVLAACLIGATVSAFYEGPDWFIAGVILAVVSALFVVGWLTFGVLMPEGAMS